MSVPPAANLHPSTLTGNHCSNCAAYVATTKAGEGRCQTHDGSAVSYLEVCDKWKARG